MRESKKITRLIVLLLMIAVNWLFINEAINIHSHLASSKDGYIVTHSHPYLPSSKPSPYQSHKHSKLLLSLLDQVASLSVIPVLFLLLLLIFKVRKDCDVFHRFLFKLSDYSSSLTGRAPPAIIF